MIASSPKICIVSAFLLLFAMTPLATAATKVSPFHVKIYANPYDSVPVGQGQYVIGNYVIFDLVQWGNLTEGSGNHLTPPVGEFTWHLIWVMDMRTVRSVLFAEFTMSFNSGMYAGKIIKGNLIANITVYTSPGGGGGVEGGVFSGHGDLNVAGRLEPVEVGSAVAFIGYSW
jgi:hypothetical protein